MVQGGAGLGCLPGAKPFVVVLAGGKERGVPGDRYQAVVLVSKGEIAFGDKVAVGVEGKGGGALVVGYGRYLVGAGDDVNAVQGIGDRYRHIADPSPKPKIRCCHPHR